MPHIFYHNRKKIIIVVLFLYFFFGMQHIVLDKIIKINSTSDLSYKIYSANHFLNKTKPNTLIRNVKEIISKTAIITNKYKYKIYLAICCILKDVFHTY